jgi:hypothetical protein
MSNEMTLFGKPNNATLALLSGIEDNLTSTLAGGASGNKRISIEGGAFREFVGGKEVRVSEERSMKVILINAAPVSRMFFEGTYVKGQKTKPTCWSPSQVLQGLQATHQGLWPRRHPRLPIPATYCCGTRRRLAQRVRVSDHTAIDIRVR